MFGRAFVGRRACARGKRKRGDLYYWWGIGLRACHALADTIYLTKVQGTFEGDVFFPEIDEDEWRLVSSEPHLKDEKNAYDYEFCVYERKKAE